MSNKKQPEIEQPGWLRKVCIWLARIFLGLLVIAISYCICSPYLSPERRATNNDHTRLGWYLIGLAVTGGVVLCIPRVITSSSEKYFITRVLTTGITGGAFALLLPIAVKSATTGVGGLRHSILLATGGLLAILTLGETRRKNDIDKDKNDKDHRRQVRAERRERYTKAIEQLGDEKAPIRMGGVYTLVGLVDEWLEEKSLSDDQKLKEGQVIINNLCAYIRSPFTLASHYDELSKDSPTASYKDREQEFYTDKADFKAEADVRLGIIKEIHDRLQGSEENTPGKWSGFEYNFSGSTFFYPIDFTNSYYAKPINFSGSVYKGWANFRNSTYQGQAYFRNSTYQGQAYFYDSTYQGQAYFRNSTYQGWANFSYSIYKDGADFSYSIYKNDGADFRNSTYKGRAYFNNSIYRDETNFSNSFYWHETNFSGSIFYSKAYFGKDKYSNSPSCFTTLPPQFHDKTNHKNTLFGSHNNDFTVDTNKGCPIDLNKDIPLDCKLLNPEQKNYLKDVFHEMEKINNKILETKGPKESAEILEELQNFNRELHEWREEATAVNMEDVTAEDTES